MNKYLAKLDKDDTELLKSYLEEYTELEPSVNMFDYLVLLRRDLKHINDTIMHILQYYTHKLEKLPQYAEWVSKCPYTEYYINRDTGDLCKKVVLITQIILDNKTHRVLITEALLKDIEKHLENLTKREEKEAERELDKLNAEFEKYLKVYNKELNKLKGTLWHEGHLEPLRQIERLKENFNGKTSVEYGTTDWKIYRTSIMHIIYNLKAEINSIQSELNDL